MVTISSNARKRQIEETQRPLRAKEEELQRQQTIAMIKAHHTKDAATRAALDVHLNRYREVA